MPNFKSSLQKFSSSLQRIISHNIDITLIGKQDILDFKQKKNAYYINLFKTSFNELLSSVNEISEKDNRETIEEIKSDLTELKQSFENKDLEKLSQIAKKLENLDSKIIYPKETQSLSFKIKNLPLEIADDMNADLNELEKCFNSECYRSAVILCARLLETSLHRKYYDSTNLDILEKNPGIGLGTLVAKMKEKNISLDPAITQQIHLINQVRIYTVHRKKQAFLPNKDQAQAIILYTIDIIKKLF